MPLQNSKAYLDLESGWLDEDGKRIEVDTEEFYEWLHNNDSFRVEAGDNSYRARKESYTGTDYWYGVKKVQNKLHKRFVGKTHELSKERLSAVAENIRQPSAKGSSSQEVVEVKQVVAQVDLKEEIAGLKSQIEAMQQQLTILIELQGKEIA